MAKFSIGDRVISMDRDSKCVPYGELGTVIERDTSPYVKWDYGKTWAKSEEKMELVEPKQTEDIKLAEKNSDSIEIKHNITNEELSKMIDELKRQPTLVQLWDDSVEFTPTEMPKIERFEFGYKDQYGMEITHRFHGTEFEYSLVDIVANFTLFLKGVGYTDEEIGEFINEGRM